MTFYLMNITFDLIMSNLTSLFIFLIKAELIIFNL